MKKVIFVFIASFLFWNSYSQTVSDQVRVNDNRTVNEVPTFLTKALRIDFKTLDNINLPNWKGSAGIYSATMTLAPWSDYTGGFTHQLNFNDGGLFYRTGNKQTNVWNEWKLLMTNDGKVGIKTNKPQYELDVNGTIRAKEVRVETGWADFVFADDYNLPTLKEVKLHINENKHLPGIPTESEVHANGVDLGEMQVKLLQKIEELTLYAIQQQETIDKLSSRIEELENK